MEMELPAGPLALAKTYPSPLCNQLHCLGRGRKIGQIVAKLVFDVSDVKAFCSRAAKHELGFSWVLAHRGQAHQAPVYGRQA